MSDWASMAALDLFATWRHCRGRANKTTAIPLGVSAASGADAFPWCTPPIGTPPTVRASCSARSPCGPHRTAQPQSRLDEHQRSRPGRPREDVDWRLRGHDRRLILKPVRGDGSRDVNRVTPAGSRARAGVMGTGRCDRPCARPSCCCTHAERCIPRLSRQPLPQRGQDW